MSTALALARPSHELAPAPQDAPSEGMGLTGKLVGWEYVPKRGITIDEWINDGDIIQEFERRSGFWLGDWARKGLELFGQGQWSQAMREHGYALQTVKNASSTALKFPAHERVYDGLAYSHYQEAKDLPLPIAREALRHAQAERLSAGDFRVHCRTVKQRLRREGFEAFPTPSLGLDTIHLVVGDSTAMPLPGGLVNAIVTSPPYALDKLYDEGGDVAARGWWQFMRAWGAEAYRVGADNCRLALNVPLDTTAGGDRPTSAEATAAMMAAGWKYKRTLVWHDDHLGNSLARGSVDSASSPNPYAPVEHIVLFYKGSWGRETDRPSDIHHDDWLKWLNGYWTFPGESSPWEDHPAPFPLELPKRLIHMLTFPGDLILDPFLGSGTVAVAAAQAGRRMIGIDRSPFYVASSTRRLVQQYVRRRAA